MTSSTNPSISFERHIQVVRERDELRNRLNRVNDLIGALNEQSRDSESKELEEILKLLETK